jgi:hypothetical protein
MRKLVLFLSVLAAVAALATAPAPPARKATTVRRLLLDTTAGDAVTARGSPRPARGDGAAAAQGDRHRACRRRGRDTARGAGGRA